MDTTRRKTHRKPSLSASQTPRLGNTVEMFGKEQAEQLKIDREAKFTQDPPRTPEEIEEIKRAAVIFMIAASK